MGSNFSKILKKEVQEMRDKEFSESLQITIGELINQLKAIELREGDDEQYVIFDFGGYVPDGIDSWRGSYSELAIGHANKPYREYPKLSDFINMLESAIGSTFYGWKGGEFEMNEDTPIWVDNYGEYTETVVVGVIDDGFRIIIETRYIKY